MPEWTLKLRGGPWDGQETTADRHEPVLLIWRCGKRDCAGHASFDPADPRIRLDTVTAYNRTDVDERKRVATYEVGEGVGGGPERDERELVGVGAGEYELPKPGERLEPA